MSRYVCVRCFAKLHGSYRKTNISAACRQYRRLWILESGWCGSQAKLSSRRTSPNVSQFASHFAVFGSCDTTPPNRSRHATRALLARTEVTDCSEQEDIISFLQNNSSERWICHLQALHSRCTPTLNGQRFSCKLLVRGRRYHRLSRYYTAPDVRSVVAQQLGAAIRREILRASF